MKKLILTICAAVAVLSFTACQKSSEVSLTLEKQWTTNVESEYMVMDFSKPGKALSASSEDGINFYINETPTVKSIKYSDEKTTGTITLIYEEGTVQEEEGEIAFKDLTESTVSIEIKGIFFPFTVSNHTLKSAE